MYFKACFNRPFFTEDMLFVCWMEHGIFLTRVLKYFLKFQINNKYVETSQTTPMASSMYLVS